MSCSIYSFRYGTGGVLSATYRNCGDNTPFLISETGGVSGAPYLSGGGNFVITDNSIVTYTGALSAGAKVGGFVYNEPVLPWAQYVLSTAVSAVKPLSARFQG